jgi:hypothetical protein
MENEKAKEEEILEGLIQVDYLLKKIPEFRERILKYEIKDREQSILLIKGNLRLMRIQTWTVVKSAVWTGLTVFFLILALGQVGVLLRGAEDLSRVLEQVPTPFARELELDTFFDPSSAVWSYASALPEFTIQDATVIAIMSMLLVLGFKGYLVFAHYRQAGRMKVMLVEMNQERKMLQSWLAKEKKKE